MPPSPQQPPAALRAQVKDLYKQLLYMGREYPNGGIDYFRPKLKAAFLKKRTMSDPAEIEAALKQGDYIKKELEALWFLRKYRHVKQNYYEPKD
ncbi:lyr motif-containing protein 5a [Geranomyces variabilis]|nr:lyr motif-containing protein 5a [Geranomyces variabilis]KAJ3143635.1 LYR motif-containing protein 5 [Geranomyces variabilis]